MSDTPILPPTFPPPSRLDVAKAFIGDLARPFALYAASGSSALATVSVVWMRLDLISGAAFIAASWAGVGALYGAKALEERGKAKSAAEVEIAKAPSGG